jgi:hypothetical protein
MPRETMARESPTRMISMPAAEANAADGKSWAVSMVMGTFLLWRSRMVWIVRGFAPRGRAEGRGEGACELCRTWLHLEERVGRVASSGLEVVTWLLRMN